MKFLPDEIYGLSGNSPPPTEKHPYDTCMAAFRVMELDKTRKDLLQRLQLMDHDVNEIRQIGYGGIKNAGATCYVNTFIQFLFFIPELRDTLLSLIDPIETPLRELQRVLAELYLGNRAVIDASAFVDSLAICRGTQEDSTEFSTLFINWLHLSIGSPSIRSLFEGSFIHTFTCPVCGTLSEHTESFIEIRLDVSESADVSTLIHSISNNYEVIEGYSCRSEICLGQLVNICKQTRFEKLPKYLTVVLNRYSFDLSKGRQKLSKPVRIPMTDLIPEHNYTCFGIIEHISSSASRGHYIGHFRDVHSGDPDSSSWYTFDDAVVKRCEKIKSDTYSSNSAYVLHFVNTKASAPFDVPSVNENLRSRVLEANSERVASIESKKNLRFEIERQFTDRRQLVESMKIRPDFTKTDFVVVPMDWFKDWIHGKDICRVFLGEVEISFKHVFCAHEKIPPLSVLSTQVTYVPADRFPFLIRKGPRLSEAVCGECVKQLENQVKSALRFGEALNEYFDDNSNRSTELNINFVWINSRVLKSGFPFHLRKSLTSSDSIVKKLITYTKSSESGSEIYVDDGVACIHGNLRVDAEKVLDRVSTSLLDRLIDLSHNSPAFVPRIYCSIRRCQDTVCGECIDRNSSRQMFEQILIKNLNRKAVCGDAAAAMPLSWIRRVIKGTPIGNDIGIESFLCEHKKLQREGPKIIFLSKEEVEEIRSDQFSLTMLGGTAAHIPLLPTEFCEVCVTVQRPLVNIRVFEHGVGPAEVTDPERRVTVVHRPGTSRLFGTTALVDLHSETLTGIELKRQLIDCGILGEEDGMDAREEDVNLYVSHPLLRGSLVRIEDHDSVPSVLVRVTEGSARKNDRISGAASRETVFVELLRHSKMEIAGAKRPRTVSPTRISDGDGGLKGSILRGQAVINNEDPIDLC